MNFGRCHHWARPCIYLGYRLQQDGDVVVGSRLMSRKLSTGLTEIHITKAYEIHNKSLQEFLVINILMYYNCDRQVVDFVSFCNISLMHGSSSVRKDKPTCLCKQEASSWLNVYWCYQWICCGEVVWISQDVRFFHHHHRHISVVELGHLLTRSGLTYPEVSSKVCHDSFCQLGNSVSLPWVIYCEAFYLHVVSSLSCIPVICPKLVLFLIHLQFFVFVL